ncbi:MAG: 5'-nucleotidase C-terminal domain-containing protein [Candidatus Obscuribacterales bacterium]|nr:5'-nucleotidase C-terminal domain-containing protein [Candidatus Obscuribacterales bacterium]
MEKFDKRQAAEEAVDYGSSCLAGVAGTLAWGRLAKTKYGLAAGLVGAALAGGVSKLGLKQAVGHKPAPVADLTWGAVDGISGVSCGLAESAATKLFTKHLGYKLAGKNVAETFAEVTGTKALQSSVAARVKLQGLKGISAAGAGGLAWSLPHSLYDNREQINTKEGAFKTAGEVVSACGLSALAGGFIGGSFSALANAKEIFRYGLALLPAKNSRVDILHFNDMHSALLGEKATLPQLATVVQDLRKAAQLKGRQSLLFELGDNYSGNVVSGHTGTGYVETKAINMLKPDAVIPGNHVADAGHGNVDIRAWVKNVVRIEKESGFEFPGLATNLELPTFKGFIAEQGKYKPEKILDVQGEKLGLIGLVTQELEATAGSSVVYKKAEDCALRSIAKLHAQGVNKIIVLSHLGRQEDIALAQNVPGIAAIIGGHSHDLEPRPLWVRNAKTKADVAIVQAGEKARYLGELNLAFRHDGLADKYRSGGRVHEIHQGIKPEPKIKAFIDSEVGQVGALASRVYATKIAHEFQSYGIRGEQGQQTPLGTLVCKALLDGVNLARADNHKPISIMLKHSGDIRDGIAAGAVNHLQLSNVFLNTGSRKRELGELAAVKMSGEQLRKAFEFAVHDLPENNAELHDHSGNFLHVEGIKYGFDRTLPAGARVTKVEVFDQHTGDFKPLENKQTYDVLTLFHPVEKWGKKGLLTSDKENPLYHKPGNWVFNRPLAKEEARTFVNAQKIELSQVDLLAAYLVKKGNVSTADFQGQPILDLTPKPWQPAVKPSAYACVYPVNKRD